MLPSLDDSKRAEAEERLRNEKEIWITTVRSDGQPQASPVGFLWDGTSFLILSEPASQKVRNLRANPRVALHLDIAGQGDGGDGGILTIEGTIDLDAEPISQAEAETYLDRYQEEIRAVGMTPDEVLTQFATTIRVTPTRTRAY